MAQKILIVDDESELCDNLRFALERDAYEIFTCGTGAEALAIHQRERLDLILLDVGLPDCCGFSLFHTLHQIRKVPVIYMTARAEEIDRVSGLEQGADDYMCKPVSMRELAARVRALFRRLDERALPETDWLPFVIDEERRIIRFHHAPLDLTRYEYRILRVLIEKPGKVFSRDQLLEAGWDDPGEVFDRSIDFHVRSIRAKLDAIRPDNHAIVTRRGEGYLLRSDGSS